MTQHKKHPKRRYTITGENLQEPIVTISDKFAVDVLASHVPSIHRVGSVFAENSAMFYTPVQGIYYTITWEDVVE